MVEQVERWRRMRRLRVKVERVSGKEMERRIFEVTQPMQLNACEVPADSRYQEVVVNLFARSNLWPVKKREVVGGKRRLTILRFDGGCDVVMLDEGKIVRIWFSKGVNRWMRYNVVAELLCLEEGMEQLVLMLARRSKSVEDLRQLGRWWGEWKMGRVKVPFPEWIRGEERFLRMVEFRR